MKTFFSIKWELIIAIAFGVQAIVGATILNQGILENIAELILVIVFIGWILIYKDFKKARQLLVKNI